MSPVFFGILAVVLFLVLMFAGLNIPFAMIFSAAIPLILFKNTTIAGQLISSGIMETLTNYSLGVGPMFGLMGFLATYTGIGSKLFDSLKLFVGHHRGGLAAATQIASAGFGAICGAPPAAAATMTAVAYPEMRKAGYSVQLSALSICEGATLSVLIPPSATMIIYGIATENSIARLFMAGIVPGVILCLLNIGLITMIARLKPDWGPAGPKSSWRARFASLRNGGLIEVAVVFVISMGGMWTGFFTPTEAGGVGVFGMFVVTLVGKNINYKKLRHALIEGVRLTAMMYLLIGTASVFGRCLTMTTLPNALGRIVENNNFSPAMVVVVIVIIYFICGMIADMMAMVLVTIPVFYPIMTEYCGYDPTFFAVLIIMMMSVGSITPPVGVSIFMQKIFIAPFDPNVEIGTLFGAIWPWVIQRFVVLAVFAIFPGIVTFLPDLLM
jgi:tripartite ATP-independent transporter DctM subunit